MLARRVPVAAAVLTIALAGCGGGGGDDQAADTTTTVAAPVVTTAAPTTTAAPATSGAIPVNATITEPELGETYKATAVVRNFPVPADAAARGESSEIVLVKLEVTASSKYYTSAGPTALRVVGSTGVAGTSTSIVDSQMTAAGYPPIKDVGQGKTGSGWAAFYVDPKGSKTLTLRMVRSAYKVAGSNQTIPRKEFDAPMIK